MSYPHNDKSYCDSFIFTSFIQQSESDITIKGFKCRNRALPGDIVAVELLPKSQWKVSKIFNVS